MVFGRGGAEGGEVDRRGSGGWMNGGYGWSEYDMTAR